jgi:outer membrane protein
MNIVGSVPKADVFRQEVVVGNDELAVLESRNNFRNALVDFQSLLGIEPQASFQLAKTDIATTIGATEITSYRATISDFREMVALALKSRLDFRQADVGVRSAEKSVSIASSGHLPDVSAFAQYSWNNLELAEFGEYDRFFYGISLSIPLFSNFQVSSNVQRSEILLKETEYAHEQLRRTIATEIMKAVNNLEMAEKTIDISEKKLLSAREDQRTAQERYNLGAGTLLDLITANSNFTLAEADVVNARFNYLTAQKQMDYQLGRNQ